MRNYLSPSSLFTATLLIVPLSTSVQYPAPYFSSNGRLSVEAFVAAQPDDRSALEGIGGRILWSLGDDDQASGSRSTTTR